MHSFNDWLEGEETLVEARHEAYHRLGASMPDRMLQFFQYAHLPTPELRNASQPFCDLAEKIVREWPMNPERTVCLRKLLEAKDAGVRTLLYKDEKNYVE